MSRKKEIRQNEIVSLIAEKQKVEVADLSDLLHVSQVTVRKDLDELEERGFIRRSHGYAMINDSDDISARLAFHYHEKKAVAMKAAELIHDGDTVMIESGSCCAILADILSRTRKNLTIVTNSAFIAEYIRANEADVILLGGVYQKDSQCLVGPMVRDCAENYHVGCLFAGTDGWSVKTGFTNKDALRAQAVRDMSHSADRIVILSESEKFAKTGTIPLNVEKYEYTVITDAGIPQEIYNELKKKGAQIICGGEE